MRGSPHSTLTSRHLCTELTSFEKSFKRVSDPALRILSCAIQKYGIFCHQVCFVPLSVDMETIRLLRLHDMLHEHVLEHYMLDPS